KIVVGGSLQRSPSIWTALLRLNADGTNDAGFTEVIGSTYVRQIERVQSGYYVACSGELNGQRRNGMMAVTDSGVLTDDFRPNGCDGPVADMVVRPNGHVILAGDFHYYDAIPANRVVELDANG